MDIPFETIGLLLLAVLGVSIIWNVFKHITAQAARKKPVHRRSAANDDDGQMVIYESFEGMHFDSSGVPRKAKLVASSRGSVELESAGGSESICTLDELRSEIAKWAGSDLATLQLSGGASFHFLIKGVAKRLHRL